MSEDPTSDGRAFPETHWSRLFVAGNAADPRHVDQLNRLLKHYWKPVYYYIRSIRNISAEDAEDHTQGFFTMVLSRVDFAKLSPERGSFRGFLKTALHRFVISAERTPAARARRAEKPLFPYAEAEAALQRAEVRSPDEAFDSAWAREVLDEAMLRLRDEFIAQGKAVYYEVFREYCLEPTPDTSYDSVAARHGLKADDVRNYLRTVRVRGREIIKDRVRDYLLPGEPIDDEISFIFAL